MAKSTKSTRPRQSKKQTVDVPVQLTEHDKAEMLNDMVKLDEEHELALKKLADLKASNKEAEGVVNEEIKIVEESIAAKMQAAKRGFVEEPMKVWLRKNFEPEVPVMEYLDDKENVLHSYPLRPDQFQIVTTDWVIGEPKAPEQEGDGTPFEDD